MLIDTGCIKAIVSADYNIIIHSDYDNEEKILCRDLVSYSAEKLKVQLGQWSQVPKVVVAPDIPVAVY